MCNCMNYDIEGQNLASTQCTLEIHSEEKAEKNKLEIELLKLQIEETKIDIELSKLQIISYNRDIELTSLQIDEY